jgi:hypothetical protein
MTMEKPITSQVEETKTVLNEWNNKHRLTVNVNDL